MPAVFPPDSPSPSYPLLPAPATTYRKQPARYHLMHQHTKAQDAIVLSVVQHGPDRMSIQNQHDGGIILSLIRRELRWA